jgi:hypothetical protein
MHVTYLSLATMLLGVSAHICRKFYQLCMHQPACIDVDAAIAAVLTTCCPVKLIVPISKDVFCMQTANHVQDTLSILVGTWLSFT